MQRRATQAGLSDWRNEKAERRRAPAISGKRRQSYQQNHDRVCIYTYGGKPFN